MALLPSVRKCRGLFYLYAKGVYFTRFDVYLFILLRRGNGQRKGLYWLIAPGVPLHVGGFLILSI
jgi:hypothetical protein